MGCVKCLTFWSSLPFLLVQGYGVVTSLAVSFLASYSAIWLELFEGYVDTLYMECYETVYPDSADDAPSADADGGHPAGEMPKLRQGEEEGA